MIEIDIWCGYGQSNILCQDKESDRILETERQNEKQQQTGEALKRRN